MPMIEEYGRGNTPNPDIFCNHYVKFDALHHKCRRVVGSDPFVIATGHYARTSLDDLVLYDNSCKQGTKIKNMLFHIFKEVRYLTTLRNEFFYL